MSKYPWYLQYFFFLTDVVSQFQMNLIAKLNNPYIVDYKDSWVDKVNFVISLLFKSGLNLFLLQ